MENVNCTHCTKQFGAVDSFVEVETAAIVGSTQCCWPHHLHHPGKERPSPLDQKQHTIVLMMMMMMIMEMRYVHYEVWWEVARKELLLAREFV